MRRRFARRLSTVVPAAMVIVAASVSTAGSANVELPSAGSPRQIAQLVAASTSITQVPRNLIPELASIPSDSVGNTSLRTPDAGCRVVEPDCTFGVRNSRKLAVLFGDSHAWMWLTALNPVMIRAGVRLQLLWIPSCPVASLTVIDPSTKSIFTACDTWRTQTIALIKRENPELVLLAERTSHLYVSPTTLATDAEIQAGLSTTIERLASPTTRIVVIGDIPAFSSYRSPASCLSLHSSSVQSCSTPVANSQPAWADHARAEAAAARGAHVLFINPVPWICAASSCSPVVGHLATYFDWSHISATYGAFVSNMFASKLASHL